MTPSPATTPKQRLREIDCLVHRYVMGREDVYYRPYSTSWDAAGQVIERMRELGWDMSLFLDSRKRIGPWDCRWFNLREDKRAMAHADSAPLAVALAALRALGVPTTDGEVVA